MPPRPSLARQPLAAIWLLAPHEPHTAAAPRLPWRRRCARSLPYRSATACRRRARCGGRSGRCRRRRLRGGPPLRRPPRHSEGRVVNRGPAVEVGWRQTSPEADRQKHRRRASGCVGDERGGTQTATSRVVTPKTCRVEMHVHSRGLRPPTKKQVCERKKKSHDAKAAIRDEYYWGGTLGR